jgi:hypothetical protein
MAKSPLLTHFDRLNELFLEAGPIQAFAFGACCAQRQWPVYLRASSGKEWAKPEMVNAGLNAVWAWLSGEGHRLSGYSSQLDAAGPEQMKEDSDAGASDVLVSIGVLFDALESDVPGRCQYVGRHGLDLLDGFVYELVGIPVTSKNDIIVESHELIQAEMKRQIDDLTVLAGGPASPLVIKSLRTKAEGESILGSYWYR